MVRVLIVATSRKTHGGITSVIKAYESEQLWKKYHCKWIQTHRDGSGIRKMLYLVFALLEYLFLLPFYDIVHIHFSLPNSAKRKYIFFRLALIFRKKIIIHLHCGSQIDSIWSPIYYKMFTKADVCILLSNVLKDKVFKYVGDNANLKVIYNPCPTVNNAGVSMKHKTILFSGTINSNKGYKDLLLAFSKIHSQFSNWNLLFVGKGEVIEGEAMAIKLGIDKQTTFMGWVEGSAKDMVFQESSVFCLPSYAEGFPMAVLDAWAHGLPVVTTPVGGIPDIAIDGKNMLLFNPGDVEGLSTCLEKMIEDETLRDSIAKESKILAETTFNIHTICDQISTLYEELSKSDR